MNVIFVDTRQNGRIFFLEHRRVVHGIFIRISKYQTEYERFAKNTICVVSLPTQKGL